MNFTFPNPTCIESITLENAIGDITVEPRLCSSAKMKYFDGEIEKNCLYRNHDVLMSEFGPFYLKGNRRRGWRQPSFTINATADFAPLHPSSPKMMYYGYENWVFQKDKLSKYRRMSVRECARIQTFPDNFIFEYENVKDGYKMIGNAVPPRLGKEIAKSILNAFNGIKQEHTVNCRRHENLINETVLVGYYKGDRHKQLILKNQLYYVRSDGRKGSMFKDECSLMSKYLFLHYKENVEIYELDTEEPVLANASFLKTLGFETSGETYLCFRLKSAEPIMIRDIVNYSTCLRFDPSNYIPYFTTIKELLV